MDKWLETKELPLHFVSAAGVVYKDGKVLLIRSVRRGWEFPGGVVERGEAILDGLKREILEESGIAAEPEAVTGIYQNLACRMGYGPLEGIVIPTTVNMIFRCRYVGGRETVSDACVEVGWFTPDEAGRIITNPCIKQAFEDARQYAGKPHFGTFRKNEQGTEIVSDCTV